MQKLSYIKGARQNHTSTFARMKFLCTSELIFNNSLINSTSSTKQSKLFLDFLRKVRYLSSSFGNFALLVVVVFMKKR